MTGSAVELTARQRELRREVSRFATRLTDQLLIIGVIATRIGCSEADVTAVRESLLASLVSAERGGDDAS